MCFGHKNEGGPVYGYFARAFEDQFEIVIKT